jgi:hypothetical protein
MKLLQLMQQNAELCTTMLLINNYRYVIEAHNGKSSVAHATYHSRTLNTAQACL